MSDVVDVEDAEVIGHNGFGYYFAVGRLRDRWVGFAASNDAKMIYFFPGVSDGPLLGLKDRDEAIRRTAACAQDPEQAYGGIDLWEVPPELRARPDDYRCPDCGTVCCRGDCGDEPEWYPDPRD